MAFTGWNLWRLILDCWLAECCWSIERHLLNLCVLFLMTWGVLVFEFDYFIVLLERRLLCDFIKRRHY